MFQKYVEEESLFLITNKTVARTSIFGSRHHCERFLYQLRRHIGPLGEILGYALIEDEFAFIIKFSERSQFLDYHIGRQRHEKRLTFGIPQSTYVFSQAMANMQSSTAKHFNFREGRSGTLFAGRFRKAKIRDGAHMRAIVVELLEGAQIRRYGRRWRDHNFDREKKRVSWCFNFGGLGKLIGDLLFWKEIRGSLEWLWGDWADDFRNVLQGRLRNTFFFTKIPFNLPFIKSKSPP